ncbi:hypothetical protein ACFXD5_06070 [Streptomyces sp. NPDC059385]|uniref:hypothetical protein n=1 Tax=Streptomyces sp. NPDC059385 TaxID=3346817 RepID=UPI00369AF74C
MDLYVLLGLTVLGAALALLVKRRRAGAPRLTDGEREEVLRLLRVSVRRDWAAEADKRGLTPDPERPRLLHTQWAPARATLADGRVPGIGGSTADMAGLVESFGALTPRRLVVVGPAGSGKSTLLILMLLELCEAGAGARLHTGAGVAPGSAAPVPVLFSLSSYDPRRHELLDWLAARLVADHPEVGSRALAGQLLREGRVLPCLDGLDEIPEQHLARVLVRIRRAFDPSLSVILACRTEEYARALRQGPVLYGAAVTEARELAFPHVLSYLRDSLGRGGPGHVDWADLFGLLEHGWGVLEDEVRAGRARRLPVATPSWSLLAPQPGQVAAAGLKERWTAQVRAATPAGGAAGTVGPELLAALGTALTSPLTATLFTDLYGHADTAEEDPFLRLVRADPTHVRDAILDNTVRVLFDHRLTPDHWPGARRHLSFLARHLERIDRTDLAWWELSKALPHTVYGVLLGALAAGAGGVTTTSAVGARDGAVAALQLGTAGLVTGMLVSWWGPESVSTWLDRSVRAVGDRARAGRSGRGGRRSPLPERAPADPRFGRMSTALAVGVPMGGVIAVLAALSAGPAGGLLGGLIIGLVFGVAAGLLGAGGPVRGPRFRAGTGLLRRLWAGMRGGAGAGAVLGLLFWTSLRAASSPGSAQWEHQSRPGYAVVTSLAFALFGAFLGLLSGVLRWLQAPAPADDSTSPRVLLRGDRRLVAGWGLVVALLFGAAVAPVMAAFPYDGGTHVIEGLVLFMAMALWVPLAVRTWPRYVVACCWLRLRDLLPRDPMGFLEDAHRMSALRQVGGVYQFRHKDVQDHLSRVPADGGTGKGTGAPG